MGVRAFSYWLFIKYQDLMWFAAQAKTEAYKPISVLNEYLMLIVFLKVYDIAFEIWELIVFYVILQGIFIVAGWILVRTGIVQYNTRLGNAQNAELMKVKRDVAYIRRKLATPRGKH